MRGNAKPDLGKFYQRKRNYFRAVSLKPTIIQQVKVILSDPRWLHPLLKDNHYLEAYFISLLLERGVDVLCLNTQGKLIPITIDDPGDYYREERNDDDETNYFDVLPENLQAGTANTIAQQFI